MASISYLLILLTGTFIRLFLSNSKALCEWLKNRVEISTPLVGWNRVLEGVYLKNKIGISSYSGDLVHEIPIMLNFYDLFLTYLNKSTHITYFFILIDIFNAIVLHSIVHKAIDCLKIIETTNLKNGKYVKLTDTLINKDGGKQMLEKFLINNQSFDAKFWSNFALAVYLLNPYGLSSCLATSTVIIHNLILLLWLYFLLNQQVFLSFSFLALHANISVYTIALIVPSISLLRQQVNYLKQTANSNQCIYSITFKYASLFLLQAFGLFMINLYLENFNTRFIECTYLFILKVPDLVPNLGIFWYFFTEMFDHFIWFFTFVFQFNAFIYTIPLTIRLKDDPIVNLFIQVGLISIFKSYPSVGETGLYVSLLPTLAYLFPLMRNFLIYSCMLIVSTVLAPIMFYLWIGSGGGNANFYFAITLVFSVGQIFMLIDILYSSLKRDFIKKNGVDVPKDKDGKLAIFSLE